MKVDFKIHQIIIQKEIVKVSFIPLTANSIEGKIQLDKMITFESANLSDSNKFEIDKIYTIEINEKP